MLGCLGLPIAETTLWESIPYVKITTLNTPMQRWYICSKYALSNSTLCCMTSLLPVPTSFCLTCLFSKSWSVNPASVRLSSLRIYKRNIFRKYQGWNIHMQQLWCFKYVNLPTTFVDRQLRIMLRAVDLKGRWCLFYWQLVLTLFLPKLVTVRLESWFNTNTTILYHD